MRAGELHPAGLLPPAPAKLNAERTPPDRAPTPNGLTPRTGPTPWMEDDGVGRAAAASGAHQVEAPQEDEGRDHRACMHTKMTNKAAITAKEL